SLVAPRNNVREFLKSIGFDTKQVRDCMIVGGGRSAYYLSRQLVNMGIDVKIIEKDIKRCDELSELLPTVSVFNGDGTEESTLREQGIHDIDSFVAMTGIDEENVILGLYAQNSSSAKTITKINRITFNDVLSKLSLGSVIYPRSIAAETIVTYVRAKLNSKEDNNIEALYHLFDDRVEAMEFKVTTESEVTGVPIKELKLKRNLLISVIVRDGKVFIPWGSDELKVGDSVVVVTSNMGFKELSDIIEAE
ncbi:MAG: NAD-binding protein, partial [Lachnospiraceae bacterium]|nr:NAD-binding protein [Lachnospiraceae bacterium]